MTLPVSNFTPGAAGSDGPVVETVLGVDGLFHGLESPFLGRRPAYLIHNEGVGGVGVGRGLDVDVLDPPVPLEGSSDLRLPDILGHISHEQRPGRVAVALLQSPDIRRFRGTPPWVGGSRSLRLFPLYSLSQSSYFLYINNIYL